jgi:beta-galactosidase/beta-glucuronidase
VLAIRADGSFGSGHWYEGGGIYRSVHLQRLPPLHFAHDGVFIAPEVALSEAGTASTVTASVEVESFASSSRASKFQANLTLVDANGAALGGCMPTGLLGAAASGGGGGTVVAACTITLQRPPALWSTQYPALHTLIASVKPLVDTSDAAAAAWADAEAADEVVVTVGFRQTHWSATAGFHLNGNAIKQRGFSHHHSIGGLGAAMEGVERLHLFKAQTSRAVGANIWRMSHNPYAPPLYDILDRLGTMVRHPALITSRWLHVLCLDCLCSAQHGDRRGHRFGTRTGTTAKSTPGKCTRW